VGDLGEGLEVIDIVAWVAHRLGVQRLGAIADGRLYRVEVARVDEAGCYAVAREAVGQEVHRAAVEGARCHDVVARARDVHDGEADGR